jgi:hypothetical protein
VWNGNNVTAGLIANSRARNELTLLEARIRDEKEHDALGHRFAARSRFTR